MRYLYVIASGASRTDRLVRELQDLGLSPEDLRLFSRKPKHLTTTGVPTTGLHAATDRLAPRAIAGAVIAPVALVVVAAIAGPGFPGPLALALFAVIGAAAGAATALLQPFPADLRPLRKELRRDDVVMRIVVPDERLAELEAEIQNRHPELRIKGTDPAGSPPFP